MSELRISCSNPNSGVKFHKSEKAARDCCVGGQIIRGSQVRSIVPVIPPSPKALTPMLAKVLDSAAMLQELVPDATVVGGTAAAYHAGHRDSSDHDHVVADLSGRFDIVLEALESTEGWVTNRVAPNKLILGELGGIETGVRQMIRKRPLEIELVILPSGRSVRVPTVQETLRVKAYLVVVRNATRDYLDVAALSDFIGVDEAADVLADIDVWYADQIGEHGVASQLARQLADPRPKDERTTRNLRSYKNLKPKWRDWQRVIAQCREVAKKMVEENG